MCDAYYMRVTQDRTHIQFASRNTTMARLAVNLPGVSGLTLPVLDQTGLSGKFDFTVEFIPDSGGPADNLATAAGIQTDPQGPTFLDAVRDQLGLKLESTKGPIQSLVVDHVELPSEN
jgi:uncharacterized protein (TIGR03435 family)